MTIPADIERLESMVGELEQISKRIASMVSESDKRHEEPVALAWHFTGQAMSGCARAARCLRKAAKAALGGTT